MRRIVTKQIMIEFSVINVSIAGLDCEQCNECVRKSHVRGEVVTARVFTVDT